MWFPEQGAIEFLNKELMLPASGREQDWEIELSNPDEIEKFLSFYEAKKLSSEQQQALMALILASFEDAFTQSRFDEGLWDRTVLIISADLELFEDVLKCWLRVDSDLDEFSITSRLEVLLAGRST